MKTAQTAWHTWLATSTLALLLGALPLGAAITYTNLVPGNVASITSDIPSGWWAGGNPSTLTNGSLTDRWLTGNYDVTWPSGNKQWPYHVTLTFTTPVSLSRVREIYLLDGGGFDNVDVTAYDASNNVLGQLLNVAKSSNASWQARFPNRLDSVQKVDFLVKAHGQPAYHDVRLGEIQAFDDNAAGNLARTATVTASTAGYAGALAAAHDEDFGSLFYSNPWSTGPEWVLYDFGRVETIGAFRLYHQASDSYLIKNYQIQVPDGVGGWTAVITRTNPLGNYMDIFTLPTAITATQVRLYVTDVYASPDRRMRFNELEILQPEPASLVLAALGGTLLLARRRRGR